MNISDPTPDQTPAPLWRLAFRPGFLGAAIFSVAAMTRWLLWTYAPGSWNTDISPHWWHAHEMIFGFAMPVVAGFLLSAVAVWTGIPGTKGWRLQFIFGAWLAARVILWAMPWAANIAWLAEMIFLALLTYELGSRVWVLRQWRNMLFIPVLLALAALNTASYAAMDDLVTTTRIHYGAVWMISVMVIIIGGRVTPMFTANRLGLKIAPLPAWFEYCAIASVALIAVLMTLTPALLPAYLLQTICLIACIIRSYRLAHWQGWKTIRVPLLWSMHLSYACIPAALLGLALVGDNPVGIKNIMHLLAIGTVGGMILAMMSRVTLGHTGRPMELRAGMAGAFALIILAAIVRSALPLVDPSFTIWAWRLSALLWITAFAIFTYHYYPMLTRARVDGKPG